MKRILSMLLSVVMLLSLVSCGSAQTPPEPETPVKPPAAEQPEPESGYSTVTVDGLELGTGLIMEEPAAAMDENPDREIDRAVTPIQPTPASMLDGSLLTDEHYYYRSTLDPMMQQAYDLIRAGLLEGKEQIDMTVPVSPDNIFGLYKMVIFDGPDLFWAEVNGMRYAYNKRGQVTYILPGYNDLVQDIPGNKARLDAAVSNALAAMWSLPTQAEKAKYAHDYLTNRITYDVSAPYNQTIFSSLVNSSSVCAGYSHAFQYMMQQMGIPCGYVLGYALGGYHAWNVVLLDGEHYAMDVTWDDPLGAPPEKYYYKYFNVTDQELGADHVRAEFSVPIPVAEGTMNSFANAFGGTAYGTDFNAIVGVLPEKVQPEAGTATDNPYLS